MVDFVKLLVTDADEIEKIWSNEKLVFHNYKEQLHFDREIIRTKTTRAFKSVLFAKYQRKLEILIAPHLLHNNYLHNADDFSASSCIAELENLFNQLGIEQLQHYRVVNLEFGMNFLVPGYSYDLVLFAEYWKKTQFLSDIELSYSRKAFANTKDGRANSHKIVKLYAKGVQYPQYCHPDTVRFEIKSKRSKYIYGKLEVATAADLIKRDPYSIMLEELESTSRELLFLDQSASLESLSKQKQKSLRYLLTSYSWIKILREGHRNTFAATKTRYFKLLDETGQNIHDLFVAAVRKKAFELSLSEDRNCANSAVDKEVAHGLKKCANSANSIMGICTSSDLENDRIWRSKISETKHANNNNWIMVYLHEQGILTKRDDLLQKRVRRLISGEYTNVRNYKKAIGRIQDQLAKEYSIEISKLELTRLADRSRTLKGKKRIPVLWEN